MYDDDLELEVLRLRKRRLDLLRFGNGAAPAERAMTREELAEMRDAAQAAGHSYMARLLTNHLRGRAEFEQATADQRSTR